MATPSSDRLRRDIDAGATGDKVAYPDPAAAPLGTDAETGGHPLTPAEVAVDARSSGGPMSQARGPGAIAYPAVAGPVILALLLIVALTPR